MLDNVQLVIQEMSTFINACSCYKIPVYLNDLKKLYLKFGRQTVGLALLKHVILEYLLQSVATKIIKT